MHDANGGHKLGQHRAQTLGIRCFTRHVEFRMVILVVIAYFFFVCGAALNSQQFDNTVFA